VLRQRREDLIDRWSRAIMHEGLSDPLPHAELIDQMPLFIDELTAALHPQALPLPLAGENAIEHGAQRLSLGFNVGEVVREYGALHRCIIEIADEAGLTITSHEQTIIARCLTSGIAHAVSQYVSDRDAELHRQMSEHIGFIAHEVRNPLSSARMAFTLLQKTELAGGGRVVELLAKNLRLTGEVIDNALHHSALTLGVQPRAEVVRLRALLDGVVFDCASEAQAKGLEVVVSASADLSLEADPRLLQSAIANLVRNAIKFSAPSSAISVRAGRVEGRISIEVEDSCGGLPDGCVEDLFKPLVRRGPDQTGFGLGLAIAHQASQAHDGMLTVRDLPGKGCVFTLDLPAPARREG
jgi:signal transduction histidine kinase